MAADRMQASGAMRQRPPHAPRSVSIPAGEVRLDGELTASRAAAAGIVVFAHGSGSSRHSARKQFLACPLQKRSLGRLAPAAARPDTAGAVVSRGGRPDLAVRALQDVFEEPGALEKVTDLGGSWSVRHLGPADGG